MPDLGLYAQDQWTLRKLTFNYALRLDWIRGYSPAEHVAGVPVFRIPDRDFAEVDNVPNWKDLYPRVGVAYDLFGDGKTAIKGSIGEYGMSGAWAIGYGSAGANRIGTSATRTWGDANGNFIPDCDLANPLANGECGRLSNVNLGLPIPS